MVADQEFFYVAMARRDGTAPGLEKALGNGQLAIFLTKEDAEAYVNQVADDFFAHELPVPQVWRAIATWPPLPVPKGKPKRSNPPFRRKRLQARVDNRRALFWLEWDGSGFLISWIIGGNKLPLLDPKSLREDPFRRDPFYVAACERAYAYLASIA